MVRMNVAKQRGENYPTYLTEGLIMILNLDREFSKLQDKIGQNTTKKYKMES
jgi:hypothetical protein